jgi:hypothetical protein
MVAKKDNEILEMVLFSADQKAEYNKLIDMREHALARVASWSEDVIKAGRAIKKNKDTFDAEDLESQRSFCKETLLSWVLVCAEYDRRMVDYKKECGVI